MSTKETSHKLFGTDGIRGRANIAPMSADYILRVGQAVGRLFKSTYYKPRILIGKDTRKSGYMLEQALSAGICSVGVDTYFLGPLPTPGISYLTKGMRASAGIVISASHNPYEDNGIKIFSADGYKLPDKAERQLESMLQETSTYTLPCGESIGISERIDDAMGQYAVFLKEQFPKHLSLESLTIVLDCAHGAAYKVGPKVLEELGANLITIGNAPTGTNINDNCGALYPQKLSKAVIEHKAHLGIALDGDADRIVVVDETGSPLDGDEIMAICGSYYLEKNSLNHNTLVTTIMSNLGLDIALKRMGGKTIRTNVGDRHVVAAMQKGNYNLGGEQSGHLIFRNFSATGDGLLAALVLLEIMLIKETPITQLRKKMEHIPQVSKSIRIHQKVPLTQLPEVEKSLTKIKNDLGKDGRVVFRYSGTEPKIRLMIEGHDQIHIGTLIEELAETTIKSINTYVST